MKGRLVMSRRIKIIGEINDEAFSSFLDEINDFEVSSKVKPVYIDLFSGGGDAHAALAFAARMRLSPCPLVVTAYGYVASAAVLVLASGTTRRMTKEAWVMVHEESGKISGDVVTMERETKQLRALENQWSELLSLRTDESDLTWTNLHKQTTYLTAYKCLDLGLIEEIV